MIELEGQTEQLRDLRRIARQNGSPVYDAGDPSTTMPSSSAADAGSDQSQRRPKSAVGARP